MLTHFAEYIYMGLTAVKFAHSLLTDMQKQNYFLLKHLYDQNLEGQKLYS